MSLEICLQYNDTYNSQILTYANNIHTVEGGTETGASYSIWIKEKSCILIDNFFLSKAKS